MRQRPGRIRPSRVQPGRMRSRRGGVVALPLTVALLVLGACQDEAAEPRQPAPSTEPPVELSLGVYGTNDQVGAFKRVAERFDERVSGVGVAVESWPDHETAIEAITEAEDVPDLFMVSWRDLAKLQQGELIQPVGDLLDERGIEFGDDYSREAVLAFASDNALQCMPFGISPMVVYYNTDLVDFDRMRLRGLDAPEPGVLRWSFDQFVAAAQFATRPRRDTRGVHIDPTLAGLGPFLYSGDAVLFDDEQEPTTLTFSSDETRAALEVILPVLRDPILTLSDEQLAEESAVEWFKQGRLGMIAGFRGLVPELRRADGLNFDVMPIPVLEDPATVAEITSLCMSSKTEDVAAAADLLVHLSSTSSVAEVASEGYVVPANLAVAESERVFLRPDLEPASAQVFNTSVRALVQPPLLDDFDALEVAVAPWLQEMLGAAVLDLEQLTVEIDQASVAVLSPSDPSESPPDEE